MSVQVADAAPEAARAACRERLRTVFTTHQPVFIVDESYDHHGPVWRVTLVYQDTTGRWFRRRYRYDIPSDTLHFAGEQPLKADEALTARRVGRRL